MSTEPSGFGTRPERSLTLYRLMGFGTGRLPASPIVSDQNALFGGSCPASGRNSGHSPICRVIVTPEPARVETTVGVWRGLPGRPPSDRAALARAFVAKAVMVHDEDADRAG